MGLIIVLLLAFGIGIFVLSKMDGDEFEKKPETNTGKVLLPIVAVIIGLVVLMIISGNIDSCSKAMNSDEYVN